jgi:hypothetical protein
MVSPRLLTQPEATSWPREIIMKCARRDVFLLIEPVADYSPLACGARKLGFAP